MESLFQNKVFGGSMIELDKFLIKELAEIAKQLGIDTGKRNKSNENI